MSTALITGGHSGIGLSCARTLATQFKWDIILAGRSPGKMEAVAKDLQSESGRQVTTLPLDTSSLASTREAAATVLRMLEDGKLASLDALLCNAGGRFDGPVAYSPDGYELTFATNCLGHFLLADLLAGAIADTGRVVFTTSGTHNPDSPDGKLIGAAAEPDADQLATVGKQGEKPLSASKRYATSKLCNILNAYELDRRFRQTGRGVQAMAFDPGFTPNSDFLRTMPAIVRWLARTGMVEAMMRYRGVSIGSLEFSGASLARVAADPAYANGSGKYFHLHNGELIETKSSKVSYDRDRGAKLWRQMAALAQLRPQETILAI